MAVKEGTYRGRDADERRAERRGRLLEATLEVWGQEDGPPVTMTRICAEAGLTERYFYENFKDLDSALTAVMEAISTEIAERVVVALDTTSGDPTDRVRAAIGSFVEILTSDPRKGRVAIVRSASIESLRARRGELMTQFSEFSAAEAHELYGSPASGQGLLAATMFIGGVAELVAAWVEDRVSTTPRDIIDAATRQFVAIATTD